MVDLSSLIQAAHGGDVVDNLAQRFGLSPEQAKAAIDALTPAIAHGLQNHVQSDEGLAEVVDHLNDPAHQQAYADPNAAQSPEAAAAGSSLLNDIFGPNGIEEVVRHIATETGIDANTLNALAPVLASLTAGGVAKALHEGGFGALLSQLSGAISQQGGLGVLLSTVTSTVTTTVAATLRGAQQQSGDQQKESGGLGALISGLVGALFGDKKPAAAATPAVAASPEAPVVATPEGLDSANIQAGLDALGNILKSSQASDELRSVLGQVLAKRSASASPSLE
jgi:hypothetical protein